MVKALAGLSETDDLLAISLKRDDETVFNIAWMAEFQCFIAAMNVI